MLTPFDMVRSINLLRRFVTLCRLAPPTTHDYHLATHPGRSKVTGTGALDIIIPPPPPPFSFNLLIKRIEILTVQGHCFENNGGGFL